MRTALAAMTSMPERTLDEVLAATAALHRHLCPRQVLGARLALAGAAALGIPVPQTGKRLMAIVETDGCFSDGVAVATNCWVGRRTMRVEDYGKVALTLVDTLTDRSLRVTPLSSARTAAVDFVPEATGRWQAQLLGYQRMPDALLLAIAPVRLRVSAGALVSRPGLRAVCGDCGEEIMNERERVVGGRLLCRACAGEAYYDSGAGARD